jgi:hypothetical protein
VLPRVVAALVVTRKRVRKSSNVVMLDGNGDGDGSNGSDGDGNGDDNDKDDACTVRYGTVR